MNAISELLDHIKFLGDQLRATLYFIPGASACCWPKSRIVCGPTLTSRKVVLPNVGYFGVSPRSLPEAVTLYLEGASTDKLEYLCPEDCYMAFLHEFGHIAEEGSEAQLPSIWALTGRELVSRELAAWRWAKEHCLSERIWEVAFPNVVSKPILGYVLEHNMLDYICFDTLTLKEV